MKKICLVLALSFSVCASSIVFMREFKDKKEVHISHDLLKSSQRISNQNEIALYPDISPDGKQVVYVYGNDVSNLGIKVKNLETGKERIVLNPSGQVLHPRFLKNGKEVMFSAKLNDSEEQSIYLIENKTNNSSQVKPLINELDKSYYFASAAQDNSFVVYQENRKDKTRHVMLKNLLSKDTEVISEGMAPSLSKDQINIAYTKKIENNWDIYIYNRMNKKTQKVTSNEAMDFAPSFMSDGSLVFASNRANSTFNLFHFKDGVIEQLTDTKIGTFYSPRASGDKRVAQSELPNIPGEPRSSFGTTFHNGRIYVVGGHQGAEHTYPPESFTARLDIYDPQTKTWIKGAPRLNPCHGFQIVGHGKYIYAFGGFAYSENHIPKWKSLDVVERYDIENDIWEVVTKMPRKRSSNVVTKIDNKVYIVGGWDSTPKFKDDIDGRFHDEIDVFDLETETFSTLAARLPLKRRAFSAIVKDNSIHLIGGISEGGSHFALLDNVTSFNIITQKFSELTKLPFPTFAPATGFLKNKLYVFGGMFKTGKWNYEYVPHIYEYDFKDNKWRHTGRYVKEAKGFSQVIDYKGKLGVLGGHTYLEDKDTPVKTVEVFDINI